MTDKEILKKLAVIDGRLYSIMQATAVLIGKIPGGNYDAAVKRMNDDAETYSRMLLNEIEAQDLSDGDT